MITVQRFVVNFIEENCYVLHDETREAVIVDCGAFRDEEKAAISSYITEHQLTPRHLLCTHGHFDHIFGAQYVHDTYGLQPEVSHDERATYEQAAPLMQQFIHRALPIELPPLAPSFAEGDDIHFGTHTLRVIATPGHTPGGVCFYCEAEHLLLSGDSLFRGSIGRCDLPGGNEFTLINALRTKLLALPDDVQVLPGHGPTTTISDERRRNPYLQ